MAHLSANAVKQIEEIIERYQDERTPLMMILSAIQNEYGYIPAALCGGDIFLTARTDAGACEESVGED